MQHPSLKDIPSHCHVHLQFAEVNVINFVGMMTLCQNLYTPSSKAHLTHKAAGNPDFLEMLCMLACFRRHLTSLQM